MVTMLFMSKVGLKSVGNLMTRERITTSHMVIAMSNATIVTRKGICERSANYGKVRKEMTRSKMETECRIKTSTKLLLQV